MTQSGPGSVPRGPIWTVGHGTRATEDLADLLRAAGVATVIDVRRYPQGRRQPHLSRERLEVDLPRLDLRFSRDEQEPARPSPSCAPRPSGGAATGD